jgi:hypothetical protein
MPHLANMIFAVGTGIVTIVIVACLVSLGTHVGITRARCLIAGTANRVSIIRLAAVGPRGFGEYKQQQPQTRPTRQCSWASG